SENAPETSWYIFPIPSPRLLSYFPIHLYVRASSRLGDFGQLRDGLGLLPTRPQILDPDYGYSSFYSYSERRALDSSVLSNRYPAGVLDFRGPLWHRQISQLGVRLLAYTGVLKIGASRSSALQSINPLISATVAIVVLKESATPPTVVGTLL